MPKEQLAETRSCQSRIIDAIKVQDAKTLFALISELNLALTNNDIYGSEQTEFFREEIDRFLSDKKRIHLLVPLGDNDFSHLNIYREDGEISFQLGDGAGKKLKERWNEIQ